MSERMREVREAVPVRSFGTLIEVEPRLALREPIGLVCGLGVPVQLLVIFGSIPAPRQPISRSSSVTYLVNYIPVLIGLVLTMIALMPFPSRS